MSTSPLGWGPLTQPGYWPDPGVRESVGFTMEGLAEGHYWEDFDLCRSVVSVFRKYKNYLRNCLLPHLPVEERIQWGEALELAAEWARVFESGNRNGAERITVPGMVGAARFRKWHWKETLKELCDLVVDQQCSLRGTYLNVDEWNDDELLEWAELFCIVDAWLEVRCGRHDTIQNIGEIEALVLKMKGRIYSAKPA